MSTLPFYDESAEPGKNRPVASEPTLLPNLVEAKTPTQLQMAEDTVAAFRGWQVRVNHVDIHGAYDTKHLRDLHDQLVGDIYPIIGATRGDELSYAKAMQQKDPKFQAPEAVTARTGASGEIIPLLPAAEVNDQLDKLAAQLKGENMLMGLDKKEFVGRVTEHYLAYAQAAPFTSGTPHVLGAAFWQLGKEAGYEVNLSKAANLAEVTDATLRAGKDADKSRLSSVLSSVIEEGEGPEAALRRKITMQVVKPKPPPEMEVRQLRGELLQAGVSFAQVVGGEAGKEFRASMRAVMAGDTAPAHLNTIRTTARANAGPDRQDDAARLERTTNQLDVMRRTEQAQGRQQEAAQARPSREMGPNPAELTR